MSMDISILVDISIILIGAKIFGEIAERLKFPSLFGEIIGGLIIGALTLVKPTEFMNQIANFGILFLFFMLGITFKISDVRRDFRPTFLITIGGTVVSFIIGFIFGYVLFDDTLKALFTGTAVMSTSTMIALRMMHGAGEINTKLFNLASAVSRFDDIFVVLMITVLTSVMLAGSQLLFVVLALVIVLALFVVTEKWISIWLGRFIDMFRGLKDEYMLIAILLVIMFIVSFIVEGLNIGGVIGAFLVGYSFSKSSITESEIIPKMKTIGYGFFIPLFFTYAAVSVNLGSVSTSLGFVIVLAIVAVLAKFMGTAILAWWEGHKGREMWMLGTAMIPRGEYALAIAYIALSLQFIDIPLYSMIVIFVLLSIVATPIAFKLLKKREF